MAKIAVIQHLFPILNSRDAKQLSGFSKQVYTRFFEVLVEESGYEVWCAANLDDYLALEHEQPTLVICSPFAEIGNLAPGFNDLKKIQETFAGVPVVVWTSRDEASLKETVLKEYGVLAFYTGNLLDAPDYFADLVLGLP